MTSAVLSETRFDVYRTITRKIVEAVETGADACIMPWHSGASVLSRPTNALTRAPYRGINVLALWVEATFKGYGLGVWASYRQWQHLGAQVRKGERGSPVVFYKEVEREDFGVPDGGVDKPKLIARASKVFNAAQVENWSPPQPRETSRVEAVLQAESFVAATGAQISHTGAMACYRAKADYIEMPPRASFRGTPTSSPTESYYAVLLHELTHWSGAAHRLDRQFGRYGDAAYAMEELVAELGAAFLCADLRIAHEPRPDHAAYIQSWLKVLMNDRRAIFMAAGRAAQAAEYLAGK
jgi:antirestriction protein ArdC